MTDTGNWEKPDTSPPLQNLMKFCCFWKKYCPEANVISPSLRQGNSSALISTTCKSWGEYTRNNFITRKVSVVPLAYFVYHIRSIFNAYPSFHIRLASWNNLQIVAKNAEPPAHWWQLHRICVFCCIQKVLFNCKDEHTIFAWSFSTTSG